MPRVRSHVGHLIYYVGVQRRRCACAAQGAGCVAEAHEHDGNAIDDADDVDVRDDIATTLMSAVAAMCGWTHAVSVLAPPSAALVVESGIATALLEV
jgi:hypothetical protein